MLSITKSISVEDIFSRLNVDFMSKVALMSINAFNSKIICKHIEHIVKLNFTESEVSFSDNIVDIQVFNVTELDVSKLEVMLEQITHYLISQLDKELYSEFFDSFRALTNFSADEIHDKLIEIQSLN